jgi:predicted nucleic acid-binding protein
MIYFDSSALVKRYIKEKGSEKVDALLEEGSIPVASRLAYPEILAAITRRHKAGEIETLAFERIKKSFKADWTSLTVIELSAEVFRFIDKVIDKYGLKGADSLHLSTALWLRESMRESVIFVASDLELLGAAKSEKLETLDPQVG